MSLPSDGDSLSVFPSERDNPRLAATSRIPGAKRAASTNTPRRTAAMAGCGSPSANPSDAPSGPSAVVRRPAGVTMRVTKISTGLACSLAVILLLGASGAAAVGILLGPQGDGTRHPVPSRAAPRLEGAALPEAVEPGPARRSRLTPAEESNPGEVLLSLK
jgi:hypothetical protein